MDKGELFNHTFEIRPAENGGFLVMVSRFERVESGRIIAALSDIGDLLEWLGREGHAWKGRAGPEPGP
jgi:hypothetical protein